MAKKLTTDAMLAELKQIQPQYVRIAIYPVGTEVKCKLTYRNSPCVILPDENSKFYTNYPDSKTEYNTETHKVRWGRFRYLKRNGHHVNE